MALPVPIQQEEEWDKHQLTGYGQEGHIMTQYGVFMKKNADIATVAAVATADGPAGIAIVRLSGPAALAVADRVVRCTGAPPSQRPSGTFFHAVFTDADDSEMGLDDGLVLIFRAPHSYTGEDAVELQGHGGGVVARRVLQAVFRAGAEPAAPGEFTRRAFLNGRIDLTQAEAVLDLIQAQTERAARAAREQAEGGLRRRVETLYEGLTAVCADVEAMLDFEEGELPEQFLAQNRAEIGRLGDAIATLRASWGEGHLLREGLLVAIAGRVNAGKSSLLNALLGHQRAIVSADPGTTRDTIEAEYALGGILLRLVDTAGMRQAVNAVEREGIDRARRLMARADLILYVVDGSAPVDAAEREDLSKLPADGTVVVVNKADLVTCAAPAQVAEALATAVATPVVRCSTKEPAGVQEVVRALREKIEAAAGQHTGVTINQRHLVELGRAQAALEEAGSLLGTTEQLVLAATPLRAAAEALGRTTGRVYSDDLLDTIFVRFCVGK